MRRIVKLPHRKRGYILEKVIGVGLFCHINIKPRIRVINFVGKIISYKEYNILVKAGKGGYAIHINENCVLNCYEERFQWGCWASLVNDAWKTFDMRKGKRAINNCEIRVDTKRQSVSIWTTKNIIAHDELLACYYDNYVFNELPKNITYTIIPF